MQMVLDFGLIEKVGRLARSLLSEDRLIGHILKDSCNDHGELIQRCFSYFPVRLA